jgi:Xaa-Pro aminopeptidase
MAIEGWDPEWSTPVFSTAERDRRWKRLRELMARDGIDYIVCLPQTGRFNRGNASALYLTQLGENDEWVTVLFPREGNVIAWPSWGGIWPTSNWGIDIRGAASRGSGASDLIGALKELGFQRGTVGVAGLSPSLLAYVRQSEGEANWRSVEMIKEAFPNARVVSASGVLGEARYQKGEEEIEFIRRGVQVSEKTIEAIRQHARVGAVERQVYARMLYTSAAEGGSMPVMYGWYCGPFGKMYHRLEQPTFRKFQPGDVLTIEIEGRWASYVGRTDQTFSIGPAHPDLRDGYKLACESFNRVFEALKPGVTVGELTEIGEVKGMNGRGTARLIMHGWGLGDDGPLYTGAPRASPELLRLEIKEECCILLKPGASVEGKGSCGTWGDTVVIRRGGAQRLGTRRQELYELV